MLIKKNHNGSQTVLALQGRLDTTTADSLQSELNSVFAQGVDELVLDFADLAYLSSAGLRVILAAQKTINAQNGKMLVRNVNNIILEVLEMTGFIDILTIEK